MSRVTSHRHLNFEKAIDNSITQHGGTLKDKNLANLKKRKISNHQISYLYSKCNKSNTKFDKKILRNSPLTFHDHLEINARLHQSFAFTFACFLPQCVHSDT